MKRLNSHRKSKKQDRNRTKYLERFYKVKPFECWNLDTHIVNFILPRLKYFKKYSVKHFPCSYWHENVTSEEGCGKWNEDIDKMIFSLEFFKRQEVCNFFEEGTEDHKLWIEYLEKRGAVYEGLLLFIENLTSLWD